jgi:hypothetical protein
MCDRAWNRPGNVGERAMPVLTRACSAELRSRRPTLLLRDADHDPLVWHDREQEHRVLGRQGDLRACGQSEIGADARVVFLDLPRGQAMTEANCGQRFAMLRGAGRRAVGDDDRLRRGPPGSVAEA